MVVGLEPFDGFKPWAQLPELDPTCGVFYHKGRDLFQGFMEEPGLVQICLFLGSKRTLSGAFLRRL